MKDRTYGLVHVSAFVRKALCAVAVSSVLFAYGCGGDSHQAGTAEKYPTGISEEIEQQLKYDARVERFEPEGEDLVVEVNDAWLNSPPGMRERALGQWYSLWRPSHSAASKVVVKFEGGEIERWTAEKGYQPASKEEKSASEG